MEVERDHALDRPTSADDDVWAPEDALVAQANRAEQASGEQDQLSFEALEAEATFDRVLFDGGEFGTEAAVGSTDEEEFLGLPGLLEPDQVAVLLRQRQAEQQARQRSGRRPAPGSEAAGPDPAEPPVATHKAMAMLRKELNGLVGAWHHRTGQPHGAIHAELRRECGGPPSAQASADQLQERISTIRRWAASGRRLA